MSTKKMSAKYKCDEFFDVMRAQRLSLSYDDVLLLPGYSTFVPKDANLRARISKNISGNMPIVSSPMDTVTEEAMAIAMAKCGGMGIIHKNLSPQDQAKAVARVKHNLSAFITAPICIKFDQTVAEVLDMAEKKGYSFRSFPVLNSKGIVIGIVSTKDFEFCSNKAQKIYQIMVKDIIGANKGINVNAAYNMMMLNKVKILPIFGPERKLEGIYTLADVKRIVERSSLDFNLAPDGTLRVGAAIGGHNGESCQRMELLARAGVDLIVVDTAKGDSDNVMAMVRECKSNYPDIDVVAGNIATAEAAKKLASAGADGVRVGIGPGSICTTRVISGVGVPQLSAVYECAKALRGSGVTVWADGGIKQSGDISKALAAGADAVMLGKLLACTVEAPGDIISLPGGKKLKVYRGMGSLEAMVANQESRARYGQTGSSGEKLVPEGVSGRIPIKGDVASVLYQLLGGLRSGMGNVGEKTILGLQARGDFTRITPAGVTESHPHDLAQFDSAPNYETK